MCWFLPSFLSTGPCAESSDTAHSRPVNKSGAGPVGSAPLATGTSRIAAPWPGVTRYYSAETVTTTGIVYVQPDVFASVA